MEISDFIAGLPKVELHLHIEGSLEPGMMLDLAKRNDIPLIHKDEAALLEAYHFTQLQDFLDLYYEGMSVLLTERDFYDLTWAYLEKVAAQNTRHVEIFFDPQGHTSRGIAFETVLSGIRRALDDGERRLGISNRLIMCFLRHLSEADGFATLEQALPHRNEIYGVGLDSSELGYPPSRFERLFKRCRDEGFALVAHAGEEGPAHYVEEAVDLLRVQRIDHGNRAMEDPALVTRIAKAGIPLTVCPLSNVRLQNVDRIENHPIGRMMAAGLKVTINSDDPAYFGGYMNENFQAVMDGPNLSRDDVAIAASNAIEASFATPERKEALHAELQAYLAA
ncbi:MAG: adenosine deaminase [Pseudomonadota bacterium]